MFVAKVSFNRLSWAGKKFIQTLLDSAYHFVVIIVIMVKNVDTYDLVLFEVVVDIEEFVEVRAKVVKDSLCLAYQLPVRLFFAF